MSPDRLTAEEQEADDLIAKLKDVSKGINNPLCAIHTEALIWIVRRLNLSNKPWQVALSSLPWPVTVLLGMLYLVGLGFGWVPAPFK